MITRDKDTQINAAEINKCLREFNTDAERKTTLMEYFRNKHEISNRVRTIGLPNSRLVHSYPKYISIMTSGYLVGDPVQYVDDEQEAALKEVLEAYDGADVQSIDSEIALQQSIFGKGVELLYINKDAEPRTTCVDARNAFVVYDDTAEAQPLFGVYRLMGWEEGRSVIKSVTVYTKSEAITFDSSDSNSVNKITKVEKHNFGGVPLVEYWNNSDESGDFEDVIPLIDAYDLLQSDRVNDKTQFTDALLVLTGVMDFAPAAEGDIRTPARRLKEDGTLTLPDTGAKAEYLTKVLNEADTDILRKSIKEDIHRFSYVPDMSDEHFAGEASGVAMRYKLLGLEQLTKTKERWFKEGLKWRLRLFSYFLGIKGKASLDADTVSIMFKRSLPANDVEVAQMVQSLQSLVPEELLLSQISFISDVQLAAKQMEEQRDRNAKLQSAAYGDYRFTAGNEAEEAEDN